MNKSTKRIIAKRLKIPFQGTTFVEKSSVIDGKIVYTVVTVNDRWYWFEQTKHHIEPLSIPKCWS